MYTVSIQYITAVTFCVSMYLVVVFISNALSGIRPYGAFIFRNGVIFFSFWKFHTSPCPMGWNLEWISWPKNPWNFFALTRRHVKAEPRHTRHGDRGAPCPYHRKLSRASDICIVSPLRALKIAMLNVRNFGISSPNPTKFKKSVWPGLCSWTPLEALPQTSVISSRLQPLTFLVCEN